MFAPNMNSGQNDMVNEMRVGPLIKIMVVVITIQKRAHTYRGSDY
jgi:hypothetical protein